eukprot:13641894-Ditylum_brightwellii.AAC.1
MSPEGVSGAWKKVLHCLQVEQEWLQVACVLTCHLAWMCLGGVGHLHGVQSRGIHSNGIDWGAVVGRERRDALAVLEIRGRGGAGR